MSDDTPQNQNQTTQNPQPPTVPSADQPVMETPLAQQTTEQPPTNPEPVVSTIPPFPYLITWPIFEIVEVLTGISAAISS